MNNKLNNNQLSILIAGAGAIGMTLGAFLKNHNYNVTLLARQKHIDEIKDSGLKIEGIWGKLSISDIKVYSSASELREKYDFILITVKSYDTKEIVESILPYTNEDSIVISAQNGIGNMDTIAHIAGAHRTAGARIIFGTEMISNAKVKVTVCADSVKIGAFLKVKHIELENKLKMISEAINNSNIPCDFTDNINPYLWEKLMYNSALNPLGAILNVKYGELMEKEETKNIMNNVINEIFNVTNAINQKLILDTPVKYLEAFYSKLIPATYEHRSSMLYDIKRGKKTEIDAINGKVCALGKKYGILTPVNDTLYSIIKSFNLNG